MKEWLTAAEVARAALPGLPASERGVQLRAKRDTWVARQRGERGGGVEYHVSSLPRAAAAQYLVKASPSLPSPVPAAPAPSPAAPTMLKNHQRRTMEARLALLQELDRIAAASGVNQAIKVMVDLAARGQLPPHLQALVPAANARAGKNGHRALSRRTLLRWRAESTRGATALATKDAAEIEIPAWGIHLLRAFAQPQKPALKAVMENLPAELPPGLPMPSYDQARRFLKKMSALDRARGRMGPRELKSLRAFTRRDLSELEPLDLGLMDGHTFDAEVMHPVHGQAFKPEITTIIDAVTRKAIGWSVALAESQHAVMDALRHAAVSHGVLAILYVDRGSGYEGHVMSAPVTGLLARLHTRHEKSLPYNSQARGLIERLHRTLWVRAAKELPTYIGADMDPEAAKKVHRLTRAGVQAAGRSLLMPWPQFLDWATRHVDAYNARPHRGLPKIVDPATGERRHMSPNEAWASWLAEGWSPVLISENEAADLFRPTREVTTRRGEVVLFGNVYFNRDLEHRHGERVLVAYDIHDPARVWVKDFDGRLLCEAALDGNKRGFFPKSVVDQAREQRAAGRARRLAVHLAEVQAELGAPTIDGASEPLDAETEALAAEEMARLAAPPANDAAPTDENDRPIFRTDEEFAEWCLAHPERMTESDREWLAELMQSATFRLLIGVKPDEAGIA